MGVDSRHHLFAFGLSPGWRGTSLIRNRHSSYDHPRTPKRGPTVGSYGDAFSYERGTPVSIACGFARSFSRSDREVGKGTDEEIVTRYGWGGQDILL